MQRIRVSLFLLTIVGAALAVWADDGARTVGVPRIRNRSVAAQIPENARTPAVPPPPGSKSPDEVSVQKLGASLAQAYHVKSAKAFAAVFSADGEYLDIKGALFHGRDEIEKEFADFFQSNPASVVDVSFDVIRPLAAGVVQVQGTTRFQRSLQDQPVVGQCRAVCVKQGDRWFIASLHETESLAKPASHHDQVSQLKWMLGEWIHEGPSSEIHFSCRWDASGNFLLREFTVRAAAHKPFSGTQRIGFDPVSGRLKTWTFDSDGGYSDGFFHQQGESWILHTTGVTANGELASGSEVFTLTGSHRIVWDSVDRSVNGRRIADTLKITLVQKPPAPFAATKAASGSANQ